MRGAYYVAIALLVAANSLTAAEADQYELQQRPNNNDSTPVGTINEMLLSRFPQESRNPNDNLMLSEANEERTPSASSNSLTKFIMSEPIIANVMRTEGEVKAINAASKNFNQLRSNKRKHTAPTPNTVIEQVGRPPPDSGETFISVANEEPIVLAKRRKTKRPTAFTEKAAMSVPHHDYRPAPLDPSMTNAEALNGHFDYQLIIPKALQLDKNQHGGNVGKLRDELVSVEDFLHLLKDYEKSARPKAVDRQEASAIEMASTELVQLKSNKRKRIAPTHKNVAGQEVHAPPHPVKSPVLVATDTSLVLAERLKEDNPTAIMNNAATFLEQHDFRPTPSGSSTISAEVPTGRLNNQLIPQKADKNDFVDDVRSLPEENLATVEDLLLWFDELDKSAHPTAINDQSVHKDWTNEIAQGPTTRSNIIINDDVKKIHEAFLEAFNLPFHQYVQETYTMLALVRRNERSSPNCARTSKAFKKMAEIQGLEKLEQLLSLDLPKLLGNEKRMLPINLKNLKEALVVKLVIMYDLFFKFCHERKDLLKDLPRKPKPSNWILKLSTTSSRNSNYQIPLP